MAEEDNPVPVEESHEALVEQEATPQQAGQPSDEAGGQTDEAEAQIAALKDQVIRGMAEVENVRRRAQRDVEHAHKYAVEKLLNDLLPVVDSLEKAVEAARAVTASAVDEAQAIAQGVELSLKLFTDTLAKSGVEPVDPLGQPFDPQLHEAIAMVPNPNAEPNSIMEVMQKGYVLNGRLARAAKVIVVQPPPDGK